MAFLHSMPEASLVDVFKAYPEIAKPLHEFAEAVMRGPSPLGEAERELIAAYVSTLNGCEFCRDAHLGAARRLGVAEGTLDALLEGIDQAPVSAALKPLLRYVRKLNDAPADVTRTDVAAVYGAGWDERALCHATLVCGFFNLMNRWVDGLGIESDPRAAEMAARMLHERGYRFIAEVLER